MEEFILEYCWRSPEGRKTRFTPLHPSADTPLPRWPKTVQELSQVAIWICVSAGSKRKHSHNEKKKKADLYGEKEMLIEFWFLRFLYNHQSSVQLAPENNISFFRALYKLRSSNTGFREKPNNFLWASIWWLWLSAELNYCIPLSELQIQHQHPNPLRLMLHSSRRLAAQPNHTTTTTFLTAWWVNRNVEKLST